MDSEFIEKTDEEGFLVIDGACGTVNTAIRPVLPFPNSLETNQAASTHAQGS